MTGAPGLFPERRLLMFRLGFALATLAVVGLVSVDGARGQSKNKILVGCVPSLLEDLSLGQMNVLARDFPVLVRDFAGLESQIDKARSVKELTEKLTTGKMQFGVYQGIEFAESQQRHSQLRPLLVLIHHTPQPKALVVVKKDADFDSFASLKGKNVSILKEGKEHVKRYVRKQAGGEPKKYFGKVVAPPHSEAALDGILLDEVQAAIVDAGSFDVYRDVQPGRCARLKVIAESEAFPPAVIAYDETQVDPAVVKKFEDGLIASNKTAKGRDLLSTLKITDLKAVPAEFDQLLANVRKAYPPQ